MVTDKAGIRHDVKIGAVSELGGVEGEQGLDAISKGDRGRLAKLHERVQDGRGHDVGRETEAV